MNDNEDKCSICLGPLSTPEELERGWEWGNNAQPITDGRCCKTCDEMVVIPTRIRRMLNTRKVQGR